MVSRWEKWAVALAIAVAGAAAGAAWLLRDPVPYFMERRGTLAAVATDTVARDSGHVTERVAIRGTTGLATSMLVRRPDGDMGDTIRRPLFIILGGYVTGARAATLIPDTHRNIVVALAYPYDGDVRLKGLAVLPAVPRIRRAILDTPPAIMLALDYLLQRPDVDSSRVELVGASFGTPFAAIAGALDARVTRVWSLHGAGDPYAMIEHNLRKSVPFAPARAVVAGLATVLANGPRLAPERWAPRISPRPFVMINASEDERLPRAAIMRLYDSAREPKELTWLPGKHVQSNRREVLERLIASVLQRSAPAVKSSTPRTRRPEPTG